MYILANIFVELLANDNREDPVWACFCGGLGSLTGTLDLYIQSRQFINQKNQNGRVSNSYTSMFNTNKSKIERKTHFSVISAFCFVVSGKRVSSTILLIEPSVSVPMERPPSDISLNLSSESSSPNPRSSESSLTF